MLSVRAGQTLLLAATLAVSPAFASQAHSNSRHSKHASSTKHGKHLHIHFRRSHGQQKIDSDRATQIQNALIRQNYLTGEPSHEWDSQTQAAMQKYQADHGWQTKLMPDSRALISLGLGPTQDGELISSKAPSKEVTPAAPSHSAEEPANTLASIRSITQ